jgi:hypothetical protein
MTLVACTPWPATAPFAGSSVEVTAVEITALKITAVQQDAVQVTAVLGNAVEVAAVERQARPPGTGLRGDKKTRRQCSGEDG